MTILLACTFVANAFSPKFIMEWNDLLLHIIKHLFVPSIGKNSNIAKTENKLHKDGLNYI